MSDLGYRNRNQCAVAVSPNSLADYLRDLMKAVHTPHPPFAALGVKVDGEYRQLNANILQIENEYYSNMRPKRAPRSGELTGQALARGGVEYVEMRSLDLDCHTAESVTPEQLCFLEALLVLLLVMDSAPIDNSEQEALDYNHLLVARNGREPGIELARAGRSVALGTWAAELLDSMQGICELLDAGTGDQQYRRALQAQRDRLAQPLLLPAAQLLAEMQANDEGFAQQVLRKSAQYRAAVLQQSADTATQEGFVQQAAESLELQHRKDAAVSGSFDDYLRQRLG
jgi:glutamate--cysteine ligase